MATIDLIIHVTCLCIMKIVQQRMDWNGTLGGIFIFLACLDDIILLIALGTLSGCLIVFWRVVRVPYIMTLFISWFASIGDICLERPDNSELGWHLFLRSFAILIQPLYYTNYLTTVKRYRKDLISHEARPMLAVKYDAYPYAAHVILIIFPVSYTHLTLPTILLV